MLLLILLGSFPIVPETKQAVVVRFGKPVRIYNQYTPGRPVGGLGAGINWRIPFAEQIVWIDKRVQDVDMQRQQVLSTDQRRLKVDAFARYRITNPLLMYIRAGSEEQLREQLQPDPRLRSPQRARPRRVRLASDARAPGDHGQRPHVAEQNRAANMASRSSTSGSSAPTCPTALRWPPRSTACAPRASRKRGRSRPRAPSRPRSSALRRTPTRRKTYAASFGKDPEFYDFYRAMQSYQTTFVGDGQDETRADQHHLVAAERLFEGIHWTLEVN